MNAPEFNVKHLVLLGGGHSHLVVMRMFGMKPERGVKITLVTKDMHTPYSGMLPGFLSGFYTFDDCHIDLSKLATFAGVRLVHAAACGIDTAACTVKFADRPDIPYHCLSVDIGITPSLQSVPGAAAHVTPVKPIDGFVTRVERLLQRMEGPASGGAGFVTVVGGGAGGVEIAFALHHRLHTAPSAAPRGGLGLGTNDPGGATSDGSAPAGGGADGGSGRHRGVTVTLVTSGQLLQSHPPRARRIILALAEQRGIKVLEGRAVEKVEAGALQLGGGERVPFDECLWCTSAAPAEWLRDVQLPKAEGGFLAVDEFLRSAGGPPNVFACGDVATSIRDPRPKAGVFAVRQGPAVAENLRRFLTGRPLLPFRPQTSFLSLIATGDQHAVACKAGVVVSGAWLWSLKDYIDRAFMHKFGRDLPEMRAVTGEEPRAIAASGAEASAAWASTQMRCGGCAAKVSSSVLQRALSRLPAPLHPDVIAGVSAADDAAVFRGPPPGHVLVQTVDFFRAFTSDPYLFGRIAANHALGDCFAMGASPMAAVGMAVVPFAADAIMEDELFQMMAGAQHALEEERCPLVGGHSSEGPESALGFTITGSAPEGALMTKGGLRAGQALVLTKPLGTGLLMRGCMTQQTAGRHAAAALATMCVSSGPAARVLVRHSVTGCTDVTGFGLLGHVGEMARASGVGVELFVAALPLLGGAREVAALGVRSSLHEQNARFAALLADGAPVAASPLWPVLVDPQTAGGLLCGVDASLVHTVLDELKACGYPQAAIVGRVTEASTGDPCITCEL